MLSLPFSVFWWCTGLGGLGSLWDLLGFRAWRFAALRILGFRVLRFAILVKDWGAGKNRLVAQGYCNALAKLSFVNIASWHSYTVGEVAQKIFSDSSSTRNLPVIIRQMLSYGFRFPDPLLRHSSRQTACARSRLLVILFVSLKKKLRAFGKGSGCHECPPLQPQACFQTSGLPEADSCASGLVQTQPRVPHGSKCLPLAERRVRRKNA